LYSKDKVFEIKERYNHYSRKSKKSKKERKVLTPSLLHLLGKLLSVLEGIEQDNLSGFSMPARYHQQITIITKVLAQQQEIFETGESVPDRIVSLSK
jgi:hypothetical protein